MNMQGIIVPSGEADRIKATPIARIRSWIWTRRIFLLVVILPTLLIGGYLYLIASDQYESEAHFLVRSANNTQVAPSGGVGQALSMMTGGGGGQSEAMSVADYLTSHDVVDTLRREDRLVERFHRSGVDIFSKLRIARPTPELLLKYYRKQVTIHFDTETGITSLKVHSFSPDDSYEIAHKLLRLGEQRVNALNIRSYNDAIATSRLNLEEGERALEKVQVQLTSFRKSRGDIDPESSGKTQIGLVSTLTGDLAAARAQLNSMSSMIGSSNPQYKALQARVRALEEQVAAQSGRLTTGSRAIANDLSDYQALQLRQAFLSKQYEAAAASLEKAKEEARRQQLYVVRVVDANLPVKSLFPERGRILGTILIALLLTYSIGWLIAAGVREHAA